MKPPLVDFPAGLRALRERLRLTQEGMALRLGASLGTYRKWEAGSFSPSGRWLVKILQVCPDEETRLRLGAPPALTPGQTSHPSSVENSHEGQPTTATILARYRNVCIEGIELLHDLARGNSEVARRNLRSLAEEVSRRVGGLTRADHDNAIRNLSEPAPPAAPSRAAGEKPSPTPRRKPAR